MRIEMPEKVKYILSVIQAAGFESYAVGGCVRDSLLGREPNDWDITTSAKPEQVKELFRRTIDTGIQHGTVTVMLEREGFEVTTYRIDGEYEDSRHPKEVIFTASLEEDLKRRDFTINAMAYNEEEGLIDIFGGMDDIQKKIIRCVGNAKERFSEDALRMLRAVRFAAQLGYTIEDNTKTAITELAPTLQKISAERIQVELVKLVISDHPDMLRVAYETGITAVILPEFDRCMETKQHNPHHCYSVGEHTLHSMLETKPDKILRLAMLFHDMGKPLTISTDAEGIDHFKGHAKKSEEICHTVLRRLKFDNDTLYTVSKLVFYHDYFIQETEKSMRRAMYKIGTELMESLFAVKRADFMAQSDFQRQEKEQNLEMLRDIFHQVLDKNQCVSLKELAVTGKDLMAAGMQPGKTLGSVLQEMLQDVLEIPEHNKKEYLLQNLSKYIERADLK
ncbi:MAG: CCA tRNA nucleotidyltransferase [Lachnospiraceae bacterium]|nr:CCA tRNA nucleotidyltransferase [Lachnospiraceae bacterium]